MLGVIKKSSEIKRYTYQVWRRRSYNAAWCCRFLLSRLSTATCHQWHFRSEHITL